VTTEGMTAHPASAPVQLDSLMPAQHVLVLALINAQRSACGDGRHVIVGGQCKYRTAHVAKEHR